MESLGGARYFAVFIDEKSHMVYVYYIKHKSDLFDSYKLYEAEVTSLHGKPIKCLRSDGGGEYISDEMKDYLRTKGTKHELTVANNPQQNGMAERCIRTLSEGARTIMLKANCPRFLWAEAIQYMAFTRNHVNSSVIDVDKTPFEVWHDKKPDVSRLRQFGFKAYAFIEDKDRNKFDAKAQICRFVG